DRQSTNRRVFSLAWIFVRALHPDKRLDVDHVARAQIAQIAPHRRRELEQTRVRLPVWFRLIFEIESVFLRRDLRHGWFEENMSVRLGDESPHRHERPG